MRRKLFQTSLIQTLIAVDNQNRRKEMAYVYRVKISRHGVSDNDVWKINSYYRISDERGDSGIVPCTINQRL